MSFELEKYSRLVIKEVKVIMTGTYQRCTYVYSWYTATDQQKISWHPTVTR